MLSAVRAALARPEGRFVTVGFRRGAAGLAKTLHLESAGDRHHDRHPPDGR